MKLRTSFENLVLAVGGAALGGVVLLTILTWKVANDANEAALWVSHTHEVITGLAGVRADTLQVELATQTFRISGKPGPLLQRDAAVAHREALLRSIEQLTAHNPAQQQRSQALRQVIEERLQISRQVELLRKTQGVEAANAFVATAPLELTRTRAYDILQAMDQEERTLLTRGETFELI